MTTAIKPRIPDASPVAANVVAFPVSAIVRMPAATAETASQSERDRAAMAIRASLIFEGCWLTEAP